MNSCRNVPVRLLPVLFVAAMALLSCDNRTGTLFPWGWEPLGRPTDSLMVELQEAFLGDTSLDSCVMLVNKFHRYADSQDAPSIEKARAIFWDARLAFASENYEQAHTLFRKSLEATDSMRYPYDAKYLHLCLEPLEGQILDGSKLDWDWYGRMVDDLEFALKHDARVLGAIRAQYLCCIMTYSGNPARALHYSLMADSLYSNIGRDGDRLTNRMNVASGRIMNSDTVGALKDYVWIQEELNRGVKPVSPLFIPLMDYNRWIESKDTTALLRLSDKTRENPELAGYNAVASAYLAEIDIDKGRTDKLTAFIDDMRNGVDLTDDATQKAFVLKMLGKSCEALGKYPEALSYLKQSAEVAEENIRVLNSDKYGVAETERIIAGMEEARAADRRRAERRLWTISLLAIASMLGVGWMMYRQIRKIRLRREAERKKLDEARRSELSMALSIREKEKQIEELRRKISSLADEEMIDAAAAREIESSIRLSAGASKADEEFGKVFTSISPEFQARLREKYPRIGRISLRMAEYIAIGMDNRHIARVMNIRPESVKQNRWRLRQALGLSDEDNLDNTLRDML